MTLTQQVQAPSSPIGGFLREVFPPARNRALLGQLNAALDSGERIGVLDRETPSWLLGLAGQAIDYRIRYHFRPSPVDPFPLAREGIWAVTRVGDLVEALTRTPDRFSGYALTAFGGSPDRDGDWQHFLDCHTGREACTIWRLPDAEPAIPNSLFAYRFQATRSDIESTLLPLECTLDILDLLDETAARILAHERRPTQEEVEELARCCLVLSVFATVRRSGRGWPPRFLDGPPPHAAAGLLDMIPKRLIEDVVHLANAFTQRFSVWHGAPAVLNPQFAGGKDVGGADGDLLVDGCLWEIKTAAQSRGQGWWLYQLLGYVLLDYENESEIDGIGFLFPRQDSSVQWPVAVLIREMSGRTDLALADLRRELRSRLD